MTQFLLEESEPDKLDEALSIYETMLNPGTKYMLLFLRFILQKLASWI